MFDKLISSGATRHRKRTSAFFAATSIIYISALAAAFAVSVFFNTPKMADSSYSSKASLIAPAAELPQGDAAPRPASAPTAPQGAPVEPRPLGEVLESREATGRSRSNQTGPPAIGPIDHPGGGYNESPFIGDPGITGIGSAGGDRQEGRNAVEPVVPTAPVERQTARPLIQKPVKVSSAILQGKAIEREKPDYPELAKRAGVQGPVVVEVMITENGRVESARAISGHPLLAGAAVEAARRWRFAPTLLNGQPVKVTGVITFNFRLND